jgi:hypothetical protein
VPHCGPHWVTRWRTYLPVYAIAPCVQEEHFGATALERSTCSATSSIRTFQRRRRTVPKLPLSAMGRIQPIKALLESLRRTTTTKDRLRRLAVAFVAEDVFDAGCMRWAYGESRLRRYLGLDGSQVRACALPENIADQIRVTYRMDRSCARRRRRCAFLLRRAPSRGVLDKPPGQITNQ